MNSVTFNMARAVGPVLGALVVARLGIPWAFGLNCLSYAALIGALLIVHPRQQEARPKTRPKLAESFQIIRQDLRLAALLGVVASVSFALDPVTTLAPAFATQVFHHSDTLAGYLIGAFGTGAVIAAVFATGRIRDAVPAHRDHADIARARYRHLRLPLAARARLHRARHRRLRLPRRADARDDAPATRRGGSPARADHGALERLLPRHPPDRQPDRRQPRLAHRYPPHGAPDDPAGLRRRDGDADTLSAASAHNGDTRETGGSWVEVQHHTIEANGIPLHVVEAGDPQGAADPLAARHLGSLADVAGCRAADTRPSLTWSSFAATARAASRRARSITAGWTTRTTSSP